MSKQMRKIFYFLLERSTSEKYCIKSFKKESEQSKTLYGKQLTVKNPGSGVGEVNFLEPDLPAESQLSSEFL